MTPEMSWTGRESGWGEVVLSHRSKTRVSVALLFSNNFAPACFQVEEVVEGNLVVVVVDGSESNF